MEGKMASALAAEGCLCRLKPMPQCLKARHFSSSLHGRAKQAAEKRLHLDRRTEKHPSGPKGRVDIVRLTARLKSCPFKTAVKMEFFRSL
jgi:hypothetical protein